MTLPFRYEIPRVARTASPEHLRQAYRRLARSIWTPSLNLFDGKRFGGSPSNAESEAGEHCLTWELVWSGDLNSGPTAPRFQGCTVDRPTHRLVAPIVHYRVPAPHRVGSAAFGGLSL
jgi:hypothetical protein